MISTPTKTPSDQASHVISGYASRVTRPGPRRVFEVPSSTKLVKSPLGRDPALLQKQEGAALFSVNLSTHDGDGHVTVVLGGELDVVDSAAVAAALAVVAAREPEIIVDLAGLELIDASGVAALARGRKLARHAGSDLMLAAPQRQVLRVLALTRLIGVFPVHASVDEAARTAGLSRRAVAPVAGRSARVAVT